MILALGVLIVMLILIMFDIMPFGAPPIFASLLLVVCGTIFGSGWEVKWDVPYAFAGFTNSSVWMIAFFMVVMAAVQKTSLIAKVKEAMSKLVQRGGFKSYVLLVIVVMLGASLAGGGSTGYYVLILSLVATLPYNKELPTSKLMLPLGFATNHPLIPINVALQYGIMVTILQAAGASSDVAMASFSFVTFILSLGFIVASLVGYKLLPDHPIAEATDEQKAASAAEIVTMSKGQETLTVVLFFGTVVCMMLMNVLGNLAYVLPGIAAFVLMLAGVVSWKEFREGIFAPVVLMMAGVIPVANALADSGLTALIGNAVAGAAGGMSPFLIVFLFSILTSTCATFTGSNMGSVYIFAPIAVATCMQLGVSPVAAAAAVTLSGWQGGYMPIDGLPAMIFGMGNYKLSEFWGFTVPMYLIRIAALSLGAVLIFPM
jgi:di/tricarboxylate transporter